MICFYQTGITKWTGLPEKDLTEGVVIECDFKGSKFIYKGITMTGHTAYRLMSLEDGVWIHPMKYLNNTKPTPEWVNDPLARAIRLEQFKKEQNEKGNNQ